MTAFTKAEVDARETSSGDRVAFEFEVTQSSQRNRSKSVSDTQRHRSDTEDGSEARTTGSALQPLEDLFSITNEIKKVRRRHSLSSPGHAARTICGHGFLVLWRRLRC